MEVENLIYYTSPKRFCFGWQHPIANKEELQLRLDKIPGIEEYNNMKKLQDRHIEGQRAFEPLCAVNVDQCFLERNSQITIHLSLENGERSYYNIR